MWPVKLPIKRPISRLPGWIAMIEFLPCIGFCFIWSLNEIRLVFRKWKKLIRNGRKEKQRSSNSMISVTWLSRSLATSACCEKSDLMQWWRRSRSLSQLFALLYAKPHPNQAAMLNKPGMERTAGKFGNRPRTMSQRPMSSMIAWKK